MELIQLISIFTRHLCFEKLTVPSNVLQVYDKIVAQKPEPKSPITVLPYPAFHMPGINRSIPSHVWDQ